MIFIACQSYTYAVVPSYLFFQLYIIHTQTSLESIVTRLSSAVLLYGITEKICFLFFQKDTLTKHCQRSCGKALCKVRAILRFHFVTLPFSMFSVSPTVDFKQSDQIYQNNYHNKTASHPCNKETLGFEVQTSLGRAVLVQSQWIYGAVSYSRGYIMNRSSGS